MSETYGKYKCILLVWVLAALVLPGVEATERGPAVTWVRELRISTKGNHTRLIFDAEGPKPKQVGPPSESGISVFFEQIKARIPDRKITEASCAAREIMFRRESGFFEVIFREKNTQVSHKVIPGKRNRFRLELELRPPAKIAVAPEPPPPEAPREKVKEKEKPPAAEPIKRIETSELFASKAPPGLKSLLQSEDKKKGESASERAAVGKSGPFEKTDDRTAGLYAIANDKFESCRRNLVFCGPEVIEACSEALKAGPKSSHAPLALYRLGLAHWSMGNYVKAERYFRRVISEWPDQPPASRSWLAIGDIQNKKHAYLEAMESFRTALRTASEAADKAAAYFELGREFLLLGAPKEAIEMFGHCLVRDAEYYTKKPEVVRLIGEAEFSLGIYDKSKEHLLRYVNFQQTAPDQDMVYAKLAEILLIQGETALANKMHVFISKYFTDTEGDLISRIRQAELAERTDEEKSIQIYDELCTKDLSPSLRRVVYYKLAMLNWKRGILERSLALMDDVFQGRTDASPSNEMTVLRDKILGDMVKRFYAEQNYLGVIQLHDRFRRIFDSMRQDPEVFEGIAESYGAMKFYSNAVEVYERLLAASVKKNEEQLIKCAVYSLRMGDTDKSSQFCKLVQSDSYDLRKSEILGNISFREQKYADAVKYFGKILQKQKEFDLSDPDSFQSYAQTLFELKKYDEAIPILRKGLERIKSDDHDNQRSILVLMAKCLREQKQYSKAAETMEEALRFAKDDQASQLLYDTAKLYVSAGQPDKALKNLDQLLGTQDSFWKLVAEQQINSIKMAQMNQPG